MYLNCRTGGGDSGDVVIQEAEGPQDPGVPVCIFSGPITGFLGGKFSIPGPHALEPDLKVCNNIIITMSYI